MNIGIDASNIRAGGGLTHLSELLTAANPKNHGFKKIIIWSGYKTLVHLPSKSWIDKQHQKMLDYPIPFRIFWQIFRLPNLAKKACNILFCPGGGFIYGFKPYVTMSQNMLPYEFDELKKMGISLVKARYILLRFIQKRVFYNSDGIIFISKYAKFKITKLINKREEKITCISHGINKKFYMKPRHQYKVNHYSFDRPFQLLYVSNIDFYKNQEHVAKAINLLRKEGFPISLILIGKSVSKSKKILNQVMKEVDPTNKFIKYLGAVDYEYVHKYYHKADGFIFASSCENLPSILLEAMAAGLPIACSNKGPMPEILQDSGIYFKPEKPSSIAKSLKQLFNDSKLRDRLANKAYKKAQYYSWELCANKTFAFILNVFKNSKMSCF